MRNKVLFGIAALVLSCALCAAFPTGNEQPADPQEGAYPAPVVVYATATEAVYPAPEEENHPDPTRAATPTAKPTRPPITVNTCPPVCDF